MFTNTPIARKMMIGTAITGVCVVLTAAFFFFAKVLGEHYEREATRLESIVVQLETARADLATGHAMVFRGVAWLNSKAELALVHDAVKQGLLLVETSIERLVRLEDYANPLRASIDDYRSSIHQLAGMIDVEPFLAAMFLSSSDLRFDDANRSLVALAGERMAFAAARRHAANEAKYVIWIACAVGVGVLLLVTLGLAASIGRAVSRPLIDIVETTVALADGKLDQPIPGTDRRDEVGSIASALEVFRDTARQLNQEAYYDRLTGIANRTHFHKALHGALADSAREGTGGALLLIDLDRFKEVNETLGHDVGDAVLQATTRSIIAHVRDGDVVARLGGDEFAVLVRRVTDGDTASMLAARLIEAIAAPVTINGDELHPSATIGIALFPDHGATAEELLKHADVAMYQAKANRANGYSFFDATFNAAILRRKAIEGELRRALTTDQLSLAYQPKYRLDNGRLASVEALARWVGPRGPVSPGEFVPIAESSGLIHDLGLWVLREASRQLRSWRDRRFSVPHVSVNVSVLQLRRAGFARNLAEILDEFDVSPNDLLVELTESVFADPDHAITRDNIVQLGDLGCRLSLDDFGTGFSSIGYLMRLPFHELKIDRSFVMQLGSAEAVTGIVHGTIELGHALGMRVVAEGIETPMQLHLLQALGCDVGQGYLLGPPGPAGMLTRAALDDPAVFDAGRWRPTQSRLPTVHLDWANG